VAPDPSSPETFEKSRLSWGIDEDTEKKAMFDFYKELIHLRKDHKVLKTPDNRNLEITTESKIFILERQLENKKILCYMNFNEENNTVKVSFSWKGSMKKLLDSSERKWRGPGNAAPEIISSGDTIEVNGKSIQIYSN
jgi:maltooligosyltrehalose trehalohydrolase